ncbi:hypothetical protein, partial, partial [Absidia glauca]
MMINWNAYVKANGGSEFDAMLDNLKRDKGKRKMDAPTIRPRKKMKKDYLIKTIKVSSNLLHQRWKGRLSEIMRTVSDTVFRLSYLLHQTLDEYMK